MRNFFYLILLLLFTAGPLTGAQAKVLEQDSHRRINFSEDYSSYYVISTYMRDLKKVRFDSCIATKKQCKAIIEVDFDKFSNLDGAMLKMLYRFRDEVAEKADSSIWYFLSRGAKNSRDVKALNEIISEIETNGLASWVMLTDENLGKDAPDLSTPAFARELAARMKKVFEQAPIEVPGDCPPSV